MNYRQWKKIIKSGTGITRRLKLISGNEQKL